ncbi:MAG TPA: hypothetical protein VGF69_08765 [Thermoanaerobaculia bacterium]|jgi:hypothetical protein
MQFETYELMPTWSLYGLAENFARLQILLTLFDGDPEKWLDFIDRFGSERERLEDVPFLEELKVRLAEDPEALEQMRRLIREASTLLAPKTEPA